MGNNSVSKRSLLGLLIVVIGVILFLGATDVIDASDIFSKGWPVILIVIGLFAFFDTSTGRVFGTVLILLGIFYELKALDIAFEDVNIWVFFWPAIIIIVGVYLIFPTKHKKNDSNSLNNTAVFSGGETHITSSDFTGGEVSAIFGGFTIDLRGADIKNGPAEINVLAAFGGIDLIVPEDWVVEVKAIPLFGGWDNKRKPMKQNSDIIINEKRLIIRGLIMFGGLEIK